MVAHKLSGVFQLFHRSVVICQPAPERTLRCRRKGGHVRLHAVAPDALGFRRRGLGARGAVADVRAPFEPERHLDALRSRRAHDARHVHGREASSRGRRALRRFSKRRVARRERAREAVARRERRAGVEAIREPARRGVSDPRERVTRALADREALFQSPVERVARSGDHVDDAAPEREGAGFLRRRRDREHRDLQPREALGPVGTHVVLRRRRRRDGGKEVHAVGGRQERLASRVASRERVNSRDSDDMAAVALAIGRKPVQRRV
mmetsp:Transcript_25987/g.79944  ORF Transcript_25987/g.79944 Transcript_25987/m.79944 type:complete len:266 (+) Transcript_25987:856-1653(+)